MTMQYDQLGNPIGDFPDDTGAVDVTDTGGETLTPFQLDYYREKVAQLGELLRQLDNVGVDLYNAGMVAYASGDATQIAEYEGLQNEFNSKRDEFRMLTSTVQTAVQTVNYLGGQFPEVSWPIGLGSLARRGMSGIAGGRLGAIPLIPVAVIAGSVALIIAAINWGNAFFAAVADYARRSQTIAAIQALPVDQRPAALATMQKLEADAKTAQASLSQGIFGKMGDGLKYGLLLGAGIAAYFYFSKKRF